MAHSHHAHREHVAAHKRVSHILKGHKRGGSVKHDDEASDKKLFRKLIHEHDTKVHGKKSGGRLDKYARGGKTKAKKGGNHINIAVISGGKGHPADDGSNPKMGLPPGGPPMPPPGAMPPPGLGGMPPPGMMPPGAGGPPPMKRGGKVKMKAGADTGPGRIQKAKAYGLKPLKGK